MTTQSDGNLTLGNPAIIGPLETLESRFEELEAEMAQPDVAADYKRLEGLSRQRASIEPTVQAFHRYRKVLDDSAAGARGAGVRR